MTEPWYFDASALVKLVIFEEGSRALWDWMRRDAVLATTSDIARVEVPRAVRRIDPTAVPRAHTLLRTVEFVRFDIATLLRAAGVSPAELRTLDAIHLACALQLGGAVRGLISYDIRLATAARAAGLEVIAPA